MGLLVESGFIEVLCALLLVVGSIYLYFMKKFSFWKERGVPFDEPEFLFGSTKDVFFGRITPGKFYENLYKKFKDARYFGIYESSEPVFVVKDPDLIKRIMTKDFHHFGSRDRKNVTNKTDYMNKNLFSMQYHDWKPMRMKLTPTFSSGKIKLMFVLIEKCTKQLNEHLDSQIKGDTTVDVKDVLARFTMDIIASCAFGLEINSQTDKESEFIRMGTKLFNPNAFRMFQIALFTYFPILNKIYKPAFFSKDLSEFFIRIVQQTVLFREKNNIHRNDFLDLLIKIRWNKNDKQEDMNGHSNFQSKNSMESPGLTLEEMAAQSFVFFAAGFETSSSTMAFCLYELACNPEVQYKLHQEIMEVLSKNGGKSTYQALQEMPYMDQVINETLRLYASLSILTRSCTETYQVPESDLILEKGMKVVIPAFALHHDPDIYPEPYKFDPERFAPEEVKMRHPYVHLPFGEGPRQCIGMRFGLLQTKIGLTEIVSKFELKLTPETPVPMCIKNSSFVTQPEKTIFLSLSKREKGETLCS